MKNLSLKKNLWLQLSYLKLIILKHKHKSYDKFMNKLWNAKKGLKN